MALVDNPNESLDLLKECAASTMFDLRELQNLLSLEEQRHFGRAAAAVGLSQPALTKSIQRLEKQLGGLLFDRSRSRIAPTALGNDVIARAKSILVEVAELRRAADLFLGLQIGTVTIGVGPAMSESYLARAIAALAESHPHTQVCVRVDHWQQLSEWLLSNEIDFFVADIFERADDERFECMPLPTQELVWFCRAGHPLADRSVLSQIDLFDFPLATPRMPLWAVRWFAAAKNENEQLTGRQRPMPNIQCESYSMLKRIVMSGNAVSAALSDTVNEEVTEGRLVILPVDGPTLTTQAGIVRLRERSLSPIAKELVRSIQAITDAYQKTTGD
jgi:DNA-binding transcriptional LysR family regulator